MADEDADGRSHGEADGAAARDDAADGAASGQDAAGEPPRPEEVSLGVASLDGVGDRVAASAGLVVASFALVGALLPWTQSPPFVAPVAGAGSTPGALAAAVATGAFLARRHGVVDRRPGAALAGVASAAVVLTAMARFLAPAVGAGDNRVAVGAGLPLALVAGTLAVALAVADARALSAGTLVAQVRRTAAGFALLAVAFALQFVLATAAVTVHTLLGSPLGTGPLGPSARIVAGVVLADSVFVGVAVAFLLWTGRGLAFVDLAWPDLRDLAYVALGFVGLIGVLIAVVVVRTVLRLPATSNQVTEAARSGHPETLLLLVPLTILFVAPAEELLNRNVVQKYLYGAFSRFGAVVVASGVFASAHVFSYSGDPVGAAVSLFSIFLLSLVLGGIYERTENVLVPVVVHGVFNAVQFLLLYVAIVYAPESGTQAVVLPW